MAAKKILVTGGTGFIGSSLVSCLVRGGHSVKVFDNQSRGANRRLSDILDEVEIIEGDIRDPQSVAAAAVGMESICHLAFVNGTEFFYSKPDLVLDVGVKGIVNVLDACLKHSIGELVLASSSEVYQSPPIVPTPEEVPLIIPNPANPRYSYAAGKIISEVMALNYGKMHMDRVLIFRPHNVYGPDMGWEHVIPQFVLRMWQLAKDCANEKVQFPIQGRGLETRSFVFIDDFIDGLLAVFDKGEHLGIYHIGTMEEIAIAEVAKMVGRYFGKEIEFVPGPAAQGGTQRRCPDIAKTSALGYRPKVALKEGLAITAKWYVENAQLAPLSKN